MLNSLKRTFGFIHQHPLARKHLLKAYSRFIVWQIKSRLSSKYQKVRFIENIHFWSKRRLTGITGNIYTGLHEFEDMGFLLHLLRPNDTFYDVGANVGAYTLLASGICNSKTVSFEPIPSTFNILKNNIDLNNINKLVSLENTGVGAEKNELYFSKNEDTTNHVVTGYYDNLPKILIPIQTLDDYYERTPILIKIDVEGFETEVLNGATKILNDHLLKAIIIELNSSGGRYGYGDNQIHEKLLTYGFKPYSYDPFKRKLKNLETFGKHNTIYIRDIDFVLRRTKSASLFTVFNEKI